jgi:hypothetical protein
MSHMAVKTNSDYFPTQQLLVDLHSDEALNSDVFTAIEFSVLVFSDVVIRLWVNGSRRFGDTAFLRNVVNGSPSDVV